ncbi:hypothetical protein EI94DRAFT_1805129 [Lactarius quietus]|nr:hypothetical protein EI94DRAFT_1805129 [Lactarius quietus]
MDSLKAAILEEPMMEKAAQTPTTLLLHNNEVEERTAIASRLQQVKQEFLVDLKHQITTMEDTQIQAEAKSKSDELVAEKVILLEHNHAVQCEQRLDEAKAKVNADIALELESWKSTEMECLKGLLTVKTFNDILNDGITLLRATAIRLGFDNVEMDDPNNCLKK